jgi:hypothetical protein
MILLLGVSGSRGVCFVFGGGEDLVLPGSGSGDESWCGGEVMVVDG